MPVSQKSQELKNRVKQFVEENSPIVTPNGTKITVSDLIFDEPDVDDLDAQIKMKTIKTGSLEGSVKAKISIQDAKGKKLSATRSMELFKMPYVTERGTYIVNGNEKSILNQMRLKPGVYVSSGEKIKAEVMIDNRKTAGKYVPGMTAEFNPENNKFMLTILSRPQLKVGGLSFLTALGFTDGEIRNIIGNNSFGDAIKNANQGKDVKSLNEIYKAIVGVSATGSEQEIRASLFSHLADNARFGNGQMNMKSSLNTNDTYLSKNVLKNSLIKMFAVAKKEMEEDNKDDLRNKDVYDDNDFFMEKFEEGWNSFEKYCQQNFKSANVDQVSISKGVKSISKPIDSFLRKDGEGIVQSPEETNPLFLQSMNTKITQLGTGGISSNSARNNFSARSLAPGSISRIDPIETPESGNIGFVEHLTQSAEIKDKTIVTKLYKVKNSEAKVTDSNMVKLSPHDEYSKKVAFNDPRYVSYDKGSYKLIKPSVMGRFQGKISEIPAAEIEFIDEKPQSVLGVTASMIPFVSHDDGNRALMGAAMQKQAILLKNREVPLVSSLADIKDSKTYEEVVGQEYGKPVYSKINGTVKKAEKGIVIITDSENKDHKYTYYEYYPLNQSFIHNDILVKKGDIVKPGDMLAEGWQTKEGKLALGLNARVGFMPYKGNNYEDGIVVSESFKKRMTTQEVDTYEVSIPAMTLGGKNSDIYNEVLALTTNANILQNIDKDGIVKVDTKVKPGSVLAVYLKPQFEESDNIEEKMQSRDRKFRLDSLTIPPTSYVEGVVKRIEVAPGAGNIKETLVFTLENEKQLKRGDKIAGRHGNKGTISMIVPDDEMPVAEDGKPLEVIFSPLAVPSRKNIGQVLEVGAGLIAEKTGEQFKVNNFNPDEERRVKEGLKAIGYADGKMGITLKEKDEKGNLIDVPTENKVTVGNMYFMKLKHKVDDKIQSRSNIETSPSNKTNMPQKEVGSSAGEKHNPQSLGEMEMRALQGHGAAWTMLESTTLKADGGGDVKTRAAIFDAIATGKLDEVDVPSRPETLNVLSDTLKSLGLNVRPMYSGKEVDSFDDVFNSIAVAPIKQSDFEKMFGKNNEVYDPRMLKAKDIDIIQKDQKSKASKFKKTFGIDMLNDIDDEAKYKGSLADPEIFGPLRPDIDDKDSKKKWGYVKLGTPLPNPVLMKSKDGINPYTVLLDKKNKELDDLMTGKKVMIVDPSEYEGLNEFDDSKPEEKALKEEFIRNAREVMESRGLKPGDYVDPKDADNIIAETGQDLVWKAGGEAIRYSLDKINVKKELDITRDRLKSASGADIDKYYKKLRTLQMLENNKMQPADLMLNYVPVAPLYLRPVTKSQKEDGSVISSDLNTLYKNLIVANNPIKELGADKQGMYLATSGMASEATKSTSTLYKRLEELYGTTERKEYGRKLTALTDTISGKEGLIRGEMMSKRQDFSGRSVIGVDPGLKLDEAAIPLDMAKNIYKPFIIKKLVDTGLAKDVKEAESKLKSPNDADVKSVVYEIAKERPINLNRQPTLHKLGYLSFNPVIKDYSENNEKIRSIQLNPLVVEAFNADFDGDQMAVHVPVTEKAREESMTLLKPTSNLINPTSGKIMASIRHEMVLGIYHLTMKWDRPEGSTAKTYSNLKDLTKDYMTGKINARTKVSCPDTKFGGQGAMNVTAGQALFNLSIPPQYRNYKQAWGSAQLNGSDDKLGLFQQMYRDGEETGWKNTSVFKISNIMDDVKTLGFNASTRSGLSLGLNDFDKMKDADKIHDKYLKESMKVFGDSDEARIDAGQKFEAEVERRIKSGELMKEDNPLNIMMVSGARAKADQVRRMAVTVGVGKDINNNLVSPIKNSLMDGLSPGEYWTHGLDARKGMSDRSVATSEPGALTRQIWSAVQDLVVSENDCGTKDGIYVKKSNVTLYGRYPSEDIMSKGKIVASRNQIIDSKIIDAIYNDDEIEKVKVRSTTRCKAKYGVCQKCYGAMAGTLNLPKLGTAVGTLASQAMGEPATQMTMNTFHAGGTASNVSAGLPKVKKLLSMNIDKSSKGAIAEVSGTVTDIVDNGREIIITVGKKKHKIPKIAESKNLVKVKVGDMVSAGDLLTYGSIEDFEEARDGIVFTDFDPRQLFALKSQAIGQEDALHYVQDYTVSNLKNTLKASGADSLDDRHLETIVTKLTSLAKIIDAGDSNYLKGQTVKKNELDDWNKLNSNLLSSKSVFVSEELVDKVCASDYFDKKKSMIIKSGERFTTDHIMKLKEAGITSVKIIPSPIVYEVTIAGKSTAATQGRDNWFSNLGFEDVKSQMATGASFGQIDKLDEPRSIQMAGKLMPMGEFFKKPAVDFSESINSIKKLLSQKRK